MNLRDNEFEKELRGSSETLEGRKERGIMELYLKHTLPKEVIGKYQRVEIGSQIEVTVLLSLCLPPS